MEGGGDLPRRNSVLGFKSKHGVLLIFVILFKMENNEEEVVKKVPIPLLGLKGTVRRSALWFRGCSPVVY